MSRHPATAQLLRWFDADHLPPHLQAVVAPIRDVAEHATDTLTGPELTAGLRHLLEAKDCLVRAAIDAHDQELARLRELANQADGEPRTTATEETGA